MSIGSKLAPEQGLSQDAVVLAQTLRDAVSRSGSSLKRLPATAVSQALREYEQKRLLRVTKITVRSNLMGQILGGTHLLLVHQAVYVMIS